MLAACSLGDCLIGQTGGGLPLRASANDGAGGLSLRPSGSPVIGRLVDPSPDPPEWDGCPGMNSLATGLSWDDLLGVVWGCKCGGVMVEEWRGGEEVSWGRRSWIVSGLSGW